MKRIFLIFLIAGLTAAAFLWPGLKEKFTLAQSLKKVELSKKLASVKRVDLKKFSHLYGNFKVSFQELLEDVKRTNEREALAFQLMRENRELRLQVSRMNSRLTAFRLQNQFLTSQRKPSRFPSAVDSKNDLVRFSSYGWKDKKLLKIGRREWRRKNYIKSAQYFYTLIQNYPESSLVDDLVLFSNGHGSMGS